MLTISAVLKCIQVLHKHTPCLSDSKDSAPVQRHSPFARSVSATVGEEGVEGEERRRRLWLSSYAYFIPSIINDPLGYLSSGWLNCCYCQHEHHCPHCTLRIQYDLKLVFYYFFAPLFSWYIPEIIYNLKRDVMPAVFGIVWHLHMSKCMYTSMHASTMW